MKIALLHTADIHVATFDSILMQIAPKTGVTHLVKADLLARARKHGLDAVRADTIAALTGLSGADAVLCTCSTLGPIADDVAKAKPNVLRIDRPLMTQVCLDGPKPLVAICLESTRDATLGLLHDCARAMSRKVDPTVVVCANAWGLFEAGDMDAYAASIVQSIRGAVGLSGPHSSIVLGQASMRVAEDALQEFGLPVRSAPVLAAQTLVEAARATLAARGV